MLKVYTDAAVKGKPGPAGCGILVTGDRYQQLALPLQGLWDNHLAEFKAIELALSWLVEEGLTQQFVFLFSDSQTAIHCIQDEATKNKDFQDILDRILVLKNSFDLIQFDWLPEKSNRGADNLAKQALRQAIKDKN